MRIERIKRINKDLFLLIFDPLFDPLAKANGKE